jgi:hypothetical protein
MPSGEEAILLHVQCHRRSYIFIFWNGLQASMPGVCTLTPVVRLGDGVKFFLPGCVPQEHVHIFPKAWQV